MELDGERSQYHFNARSYDPQLSRFFAPDLLFDMFPNQSPYSYSNNSPLNFKDPSGMAWAGFKTFEQREDEFRASLSREEADRVRREYEGRFAFAQFGPGSIMLAENGLIGGGGGVGGGGTSAYALDNSGASHDVPRGSVIKELFENFKASVNNIYECYIHENVYAMFHPDATSISASYSFTFGMGGGITEERFSFQVGDFAGQTYYSESGNGYLGVGSNLGVAGTSFWYFGDYNDFNPKFMQDSKSYNLNVFNFSFSLSYNQNDNYLFGFSAGGGVGKGITFGTSNTTKFRRTKK
ncbi:MAG: hypothetical protein NTW25_06705 [Candidatus Kapabacteria bacterium]|nr:hypothetical protein [Candidatus Kapabacteria bacterium]